jgi:hypothetical protein
MERDWAAVGTSAAARDAAARLGLAEPVVAALGARDLAEVVAATSARARATGSGRPLAVVAAMARSAAVHPLVPRAIVQAMMPGVVATALAIGPVGPWPDLDAVVVDAVRMTWEIVMKWSGQHRPYVAPDLTSALRLRLHREHWAWQRELRATNEDDGPLVGPGGERSALEQLATAITDRVAAGFDRPDAAVVYGRRVLGLTAQEVADLTGQSLRQIEYRTSRGERCLATM